MDLNQNYANCLASVTHWGEYVYTNVCSGKVTTVPWGIGEYATATFVTLVIAALAMFICFMLNLDVMLIHKILKGRK